jgi:hypothetical protein
LPSLFDSTGPTWQHTAGERSPPQAGVYKILDYGRLITKKSPKCRFDHTPVDIVKFGIVEVVEKMRHLV